MTSMLNHNLVYWFAYGAIVRSFLSSESKAQSSLFKIAVLCGIPLSFLTGLTGLPQLDGLTALLFGGLLIKGSDDPAYNAAGVIFLALSANFLWGPVVFALFKDAIITADAILTEFALRISGHEIARTNYTLGAGNGHRVMIIGACSSFNNMTLAALAAATALVTVNGRLTRNDVLPILAVCLVMLCFNTIRLAMLASNYEAYLYWHEGDGVPILAFVSTALVVVSSLLVVKFQRISR